MDPSKKPFFAGTYFPKESRGGYPGLLELLSHVAESWREERAELLSLGLEIREALSRQASPAPSPELGEAPLEQAYRQLQKSFDPEYGGFGPAPKFPSPANLFFLLRYYRSTGEVKALDMVKTTLEAMGRGGIYDQIGQGFSRYSTDRQWLVPHFEKMLYDNALLALAYLEAFQATKKPGYSRLAREICSYVLRDLSLPEGALARIIPDLAGKEPENNEALAYLCQDFSCQAPVSDPAELRQLLHLT